MKDNWGIGMLGGISAETSAKVTIIQLVEYAGWRSVWNSVADSIGESIRSSVKEDIDE